jgi:hypothetical protein
VAKVLNNNTWIHDITGPLTVSVTIYIQMRVLVDSIQLDTLTKD